MTCSLRTKIFILMVISLAVAVIPIISFTYTDVRQSTSELEYKSFNNIARLVEDSISVHYLGSVGEQVDTVLQCKNQLRRTTAIVQSIWQDNNALSLADRTKYIESLSASISQFNMYLDIFNKDSGLVLNKNIIASLIHDKNSSDFKGVQLENILQNTIPHDGKFAVFYTQLRSGQTVPLLVFCLPMANNEDIILSALTLIDLDIQAAATKREIVKSTQAKLESLQLSGHAFISVLSGDNELLAHTGPEKSSDIKIIPSQALAQAKKEKRTTYHADNISHFGSVVFNIAYIKALDWYIVVAAPQKEIEASTNQLIQNLISIALAALLLSILSGLYFGGRLVEPLRILTRKTNELSTVDFRHDDVTTIVNDLPTQQGDEVGQLANAFEGMAKTLSQNVRELMDTTSVKERMQGELDAATDIQVGILPAPDTAPKLSNYEAAPFLEPAKEVGGDLYDFFIAPDGRQVVIIGDVSGKGVPAALFMSMTVTLCRYAISSGMGPAEAMVRINDQLSANNPSCMFVTLFIGLFDPETGILEYANGGHCPPCIVNAEGTEPAIYADAMSGPLVGAMDDMEYFEQSITLEKGQRCLLYSDGVTEAMNEDWELFSDPYLLEVMTNLRQASPQEVVDGVYQAILKHRGNAEPSDDITMLCFMRK
ncbi:MAG: SpoIIE family protein phosphatase [Pseudomonadota bacterium]